MPYHIPAVQAKNKRFGRLIVKDVFYKNNKGPALAICHCACGKIKIVRVNSLRSKLVKSCGCYNKERARSRATKHGDYGSSEYRCWIALHQRCYDENADNYKYYGGRGIRVCKRWRGKNGYEHFLDDMGRKPKKKYSIDRIDVNGDYSRDNCRWATLKQQANNKRGRK